MTISPGTPIFLIGYRGTGKSTVARELAARLCYESIDADDEIERLAGKSIAAIFDNEGEPTFRDWESRVIADLVLKKRIVASLGGGAVLRKENRRGIRQAGQVVWLTAPIDTIIERIAADKSTATRRPNLTPIGGRSEIETLLAARTPLYHECATLVVDTCGKIAAEVAAEIAAKL
jgi:shikimate kinase